MDSLLINLLKLILPFISCVAFDISFSSLTATMDDFKLRLSFATWMTNGFVWFQQHFFFPHVWCLFWRKLPDTRVILLQPYSYWLGCPFDAKFCFILFELYYLVCLSHESQLSIFSLWCIEMINNLGSEDILIVFSGIPHFLNTIFVLSCG